MGRKKLAGILVFFLSFPHTVSFASAGPAHSPQGQVFDESPREHARLFVDPTNRSDFPSSCSSAAQPFLSQGVALLHGFFWPEAERSFREARYRDPQCAMAFWGMAMSVNGDIFTVDDSARAADFIARGQTLAAALPAGKISRREQRYLEVLSLLYPASDSQMEVRHRKHLEGWEALVRDYPEDPEAKAFLVFAYLKYSSVLGTRWDSRDEDSKILIARAEPLIEAVLAQNPRHPIHHHKIHLWNYRNEALALGSAEACPTSVPEIPHLWHMPSHTFFSLPNLDIRGYEKAAYYQQAALRSYHRYFAGARTSPASLGDYGHNLNWLLETLKRTGEAEKGIALAQNWADQPRPVGSVARRTARNRIWEYLETFELWDRPLPGVDDADETAEDQARRFRFLAQRSFVRDDRAGLEKSLGELRRLQVRADPNSSPEWARIEAEIYSDLLSQNRARARERLLRLSQTPEKRPAYYDSERGPSRSRLAWLWYQMGDPARAVAWQSSAVDESPGEVIPLARWAELLDLVGKPAAARRALERLAAVAGSADPDLPVLRRLRIRHPDFRPGFSPFAEAHENLPPLSSFGPPHWSPEPAPDFELKGGRQNRPVRLADFAGRPLILIFNLGPKCWRCNRQISDLHRARERLKDFSVLVVTDAEVDEVFEGATFEVASDPNLSVFRTYGVVDEFESPPLPLHGFFVIQDGRILFRSVTAQPLRELDSRIAEARYLARAWRSVGPNNVAKCLTLPTNETSIAPELCSFGVGARGVTSKNEVDFLDRFTGDGDFLRGAFFRR